MPSAPQVERLVTFLWDIGLEVGHSVRTVAECARGERRRRQRHDDAAGGAAAGTAMRRCWPPMRAALAPDRHLAGEGVLRGQARRAGRAAPEGQRHRLQPRAERQDRPRAACATSRPSAGWPSATSAPNPSTSLARRGFLTASGAAPPQAGAGLPVEGALRPAHRSPGGAKTGCCSITRSSSRRPSATRTPPTRSRSSSSCSATTARSWT